MDPPQAGLPVSLLEVVMSREYQGPYRVLLCVDDSNGILEYERALFERSGYIVVTTESAREGLKLVTMFNFDAVLLDYHMPEMNGHQLASEIRRIRTGNSGSHILRGEDDPGGDSQSGRCCRTQRCPQGVVSHNHSTL